MVLRHSFALTLSNVLLVLKVFVYCAIIMSIGVAIFISVSNPIIEAVGGDFNLAELVNHLINDVLKGDGAVFDRILAAMDQLSSRHLTEIVEIAVMGFVLVFLVKTAFHFILPAVSYVINHKMATNYNEGLFHAVAQVGLKGLGISALYTLISVPVDLGTVVLSFYLSKWLMQGLGMFGIIIAVLFAILVITFRMTVMGQWIAVSTNEDIKFALQFKRGFRQGIKSLKNLFPALLTLNLTAFAVIMVTLVPTFFIIPLVVPPVVLVSFTIMNNVNYYLTNTKDFYIDERIIKA